jgi:NNP family nitrate/nitrite transporter-like MFS transporter
MCQRVGGKSDCEIAARSFRALLDRCVWMFKDADEAGVLKMEVPQKATSISPFSRAFYDFKSPQMRAFHMSWFAFFLCFFAWFGMAPLMVAVRAELALTPEQIGWCIIGSVSFTVFARVAMGWICDRIGPRRAYTWLLVLGSLPVMGIGLAQNFETFFVFRLLIGVIGASFVITQYHTTQMFASNCVGTANAMTAGWGNLGGGVAKPVMSLLFAGLVGTVGLSAAAGWRVCMIIAGAVCLLTGIAYYLLTQDTPEGDFKDIRAREGEDVVAKKRGSFLAVCKDGRVWALALVYASCFGIELTIFAVADLYFVDYFGLTTLAAGLVAGLYGAMNLFSRPLGGWFSDRLGMKLGLQGRVLWLFVVLLAEGLMLMMFSQAMVLALAIPMLMVFALFVQMSNGATFALVPFVNKDGLGSVAGIVGAGGNVGAIAAGFLFRGQIPWSTALLYLGIAVTISSFAVFLIRFKSDGDEQATRGPAFDPMPEPAAA